ASSSEPAGSTAPRSAASASESASASKPRTSAPPRRAASPTDAPISPVPTTTILVTRRPSPCLPPNSAETRTDLIRAAQPCRAARRGEEALELGHHVVEVTGLASGGGETRVRVHRVARPDDGVLRVARGLQQRRQRLAHVPRAEPRDQRQPARGPLRIQTLAEPQHVVPARVRAELDAERVVHAREELDLGARRVAR